MRRLLLAGVAFGALIVPAVAADMRLPKARRPALVFVNWSGFYVGANVGGGSLHDDGVPFCGSPRGGLQGAGCDVIPGGQIKGSGVIGGVQAGYNRQAGNWVYGLETDLQGTDINGSVNVAGPFRIVGASFNTGPGNFIADEKLFWLGTLRGRLGFAWGRALLYGTGGLAYGEVGVDQSHAYPAVQYSSSASSVRAGWAAGGGLEWAFVGNWSGKIEGLVYDLGSISSVGGPINGFVAGKNFDVQGAIVRVGLNRRFGGPGGFGY